MTIPPYILLGQFTQEMMNSHNSLWEWKGKLRNPSFLDRPRKNRFLNFPPSAAYVPPHEEVGVGGQVIYSQAKDSPLLGLACGQLGTSLIVCSFLVHPNYLRKHVPNFFQNTAFPVGWPFVLGSLQLFIFITRTTQYIWWMLLMRSASRCLCSELFDW